MKCALLFLPSFGTSVSSDSADVTTGSQAMSRALVTEKAWVYSMVEKVMVSWGKLTCQQHTPSSPQSPRLEGTAMGADPRAPPVYNLLIECLLCAGAMAC